MSKIGIIGCSLSEFQPDMEDVATGQIIFEVTEGVLKNAGLDIKDIDQVISASCDTIDGVSISNAFSAENYGAFMKEESKVEEDGAYAMMYAYYRMLTGQWNNCIVVAHGKNSGVGPAFYANMSFDPLYLRPLGLEATSAAALQAQAYYRKYGVREEDTAMVASKNREAGSKNPRTMLREKVSPQDVMNSSYVVDPLKKLEIPPLTDGAAAIILAREDFARGVKNEPVWIKGIGFAQDSYYPGHRNLAFSDSCHAAARMAYNRAGLKDPVREVDFAEVYEACAFYELMLSESLGFCPEGKGKEMIEEGNSKIDGSFPINPSGGALCANPIMVSGLVRVIESYLQLTGQAGDNQVRRNNGAAVVHASSGMFLQSNLVSILSI